MRVVIVIGRDLNLNLVKAILDIGRDLSRVNIEREGRWERIGSAQRTKNTEQRAESSEHKESRELEIESRERA